MKPFKFGHITQSNAVDQSAPYAYPNVWQRGKTTGPDRLLIWPSAEHVNLMIDLMGRMPDPFGILYVLLVSRRGNESGRYQSGQPTDRRATEDFLRSFVDYFENDGRHHVWVTSAGHGPAANSQLVYDNHNMIFAYGPLDEFVEVLTQRGLAEGGTQVPVPHTHHYSPEYDSEEDRILQQYEWTHFPLKEGNDP
jgi:hypothetical protein